MFAYLLEGFGPLPAFLFGWSELTVIRASALGAIATIFAEYLGYFVRAHSGRRSTMSRPAAIVVVGFLNYVGVRNAARVHEPGHRAQVRRRSPGSSCWPSPRERAASRISRRPGRGGSQLSLLGTALISIMWTYDGWADVSFMGGEVKDPGRTLPLALIIGTAAIVAVYLLLNFAYIYLVPLPEMAQSPLIAATAAERIRLFAGAGGAVVSGVVMVSCFGALNGSMMTGPRIFFAMADRGLFFRGHRAGVAPVSEPVGRDLAGHGARRGLRAVQRLPAARRQVHPRHLAVLRAGGGRGVRPPPHPSRPAAPLPHVGLSGRTRCSSLLASLGMVANALWTDPVNTGITFGIILLGVPVYLVWRGRGGSSVAERVAWVTRIGSDM